MIRHRIHHPFAPPRPGGTPLAELIDRHAHLVAVGLANCRAAQALHKEITRRKLETQYPKPETLPNDDDDHNHYDPNEPRDKYTGQWTSDGNSSSNPDPHRATIRALTARESLMFDLRRLMYKLFPITEPKIWPSKTLPEVVDEGVNRLGKFVEAVVGEIAARANGDPQFTGNIYAFLNRYPELPIEVALREAAKEQQFRGELPIATVMGRISEGIAVSLPMIVLTKGLPPGAQKLVGLAFMVQMAKGTPALFKALQIELAKPPGQRDADKVDFLIAQAIQILGFTAAAALGMKKSPTPKEEPPPKISPESEGQPVNPVEEPPAPKGNIPAPSKVDLDADAPHDILFSAGEASGRPGVSALWLQSNIGDLQQSLPGAPELKIVQSVKDLPDAQRSRVEMQAAKGRRIEGMFSGGKAWLIADNIPDIETARLAYLEETLGHAGMEPLVKPEEVEGLYNLIQRGAPEEAARIARDYGFDLTTHDGRREFVGEFVAKASRWHLQKPSLWQAISDVLAKTAGRVSWLRNISPSRVLDAQMRGLARRGAARLAANQSSYTPGTHLSQSTPAPVVSTPAIDSSALATDSSRPENSTGPSSSQNSRSPEHPSFFPPLH